MSQLLTIQASLLKDLAVTESKLKEVSQRLEAAFAADVLPRLLRGDAWKITESKFSGYYDDNPHRAEPRLQVNVTYRRNFRIVGSRGEVTKLDTVQVVFVKRQQISAGREVFTDDRYMDVIDVTPFCRAWGQGRDARVLLLAHKSLVRDPKSSAWRTVGSRRKKANEIG